jgi:hypothetical protein
MHAHVQHVVKILPLKCRNKLANGDTFPGKKPLWRRNERGRLSPKASN